MQRIKDSILLTYQPVTKKVKYSVQRDLYFILLTKKERSVANLMKIDKQV